jgi:hypothetical protein
LASLDKVQIPVTKQETMEERYLLSFEKGSGNIKTSNKDNAVRGGQDIDFVIFVTNYPI